MNARWYGLTLVFLFLGLAVAGCATTASQPAPTQTAAPQATPTENPNAAIVLDLSARLTAGDVEGSLAYFADDAMGYIVGLPLTGMEVYAGKDQLRALWEDSVSNHFEWEVEITRVDGNEVYVRAKTWHDFTRQLGVAPLEYNDVYEIQDGKVTVYGTTITEEALDRFKPAFAEVMPPPEAPTPSSETPATEVTVTFENGTCSVNGPMTLQAGELNVTAEVRDQDRGKYAVTLFTLDEGKDMLDLMASTTRPGPPPSAPPRPGRPSCRRPAHILPP